jgi:hypothetical protein
MTEKGKKKKLMKLNDFHFSKLNGELDINNEKK